MCWTWKLPAWSFWVSFVYTNGLLQPVELVFKSCLTALPPIDSDPKERETQREIWEREREKQTQESLGHRGENKFCVNLIESIGSWHWVICGELLNSGEPAEEIDVLSWILAFWVPEIWMSQIHYIQYIYMFFFSPVLLLLIHCSGSCSFGQDSDLGFEEPPAGGSWAFCLLKLRVSLHFFVFSSWRKKKKKLGCSIWRVVEIGLFCKFEAPTDLDHQLLLQLYEDLSPGFWSPFGLDSQLTSFSF